MPTQIILKTADNRYEVQYPSVRPRYGTDGSKTVTARAVGAVTRNALVQVAQDELGWSIQTYVQGADTYVLFGVALETAVAGEWIDVQVGGVRKDVNLGESVDTSTNRYLVSTNTNLFSTRSTNAHRAMWAADVSTPRGDTSVKDLNFTGEPSWVT